MLSVKDGMFSACFFRVDSVMHLFLREELICFFKEDGKEKGRNSLRKMWCRQTSLGEVCEIFVVKGSRAYHRATIYIYMYENILMYIYLLCVCLGPPRLFQ